MQTAPTASRFPLVPPLVDSAPGATMKDTFLSRFTPSLMSHATLEAIFVQREKLAKALVERVRTSVLTPAKHHTLLIGPRGIGKTHLVALVYHRVNALEEVQDRLRIAWLREEEWGITSFMDPPAAYPARPRGRACGRSTGRKNRGDLRALVAGRSRAHRRRAAHDLRRRPDAADPRGEPRRHLRRAGRRGPAAAPRLPAEPPLLDPPRHVPEPLRRRLRQDLAVLRASSTSTTSKPSASTRRCNS